VPTLLDLFCCQGGAARGYAAAGWDLIGVDVDPQPRYPYRFIRGDALEVLADLAAEVDAVHASPPCQHYSITRHSHSREHPDLVGPTRDALEAAGLPWIMENVPGAPLRNYVELCGASFGLEAVDLDGTPLVLRRHRLFESSVMLWAPPPCACSSYRRRGYAVGGVYDGGRRDRVEAREIRHGGYTPPPTVRAELLGVAGMTQYGMSQAIPPAYTYWLGRELLDAVSHPPGMTDG
jgi:DNA (cytosine-5)-methyltransferase 1